MNTILQKRIEEAAEEIGLSVYNATSENEEWITDACIEAAKESAFEIINNLWISVEEALPEIKEHFVSEDVLCRYSDGSIGFSRLKVNLFGQKWFEYEEEDSHVTHWMIIPEIKGGEE